MKKMKIRIENNPKLAVEIMKKAGKRLKDRKGEKIPYSWQTQFLNMETIIDDLEVSSDEFVVIYADNKPIASAILQKVDKTQWAEWPTKKDALYGYRYAGNPDYPMFKTKIIFDALKEYALSIDIPVIRIDIAEYEIGKLRLYKSQGFKQVGICKDSDSPENYILMEYDPNN